jgi:hypothetical protein
VPPSTPKTDTVMGLPINRFVTFIKPWFNLVAGGFAAWLVAKVNIIGVLGLTEAEIATQVAAGLAFLVTTALLELGDLKWIKGHHIELADGAIAIREEEEALEDVLPEVERTPTDDVTSIPPDEGDAGRA